MRGTPAARLEPLQTLFDAGTAVGSSDGQLLERFVARPEADADGAQAASAAEALLKEAEAAGPRH